MALEEALAARYEMSCQKYATNKVHEESGLKINSCMEKDNLQDIWEEVVDAVFNCLVYLYRYPERKNAHGILRHLLAAISMMNVERKLHE